MKKIFFFLFWLVDENAMAQAMATGGLRDVKPPVLVPMDFSWWWVALGLVGLIILVGIIWFFMKQLKRMRKANVPPPLSPWEMAFKRLADLKAENLPQSGRIKEYYSRLSDIIRRYIEDRFSIKAPEMTTEEFLFQLRNSAVLGDQQKGLLREFLNGCDLVKFARFQASVFQMENEFVFVQKFVDQTRPDITVAPASEGGMATPPLVQQQNVSKQTNPDDF